MPDRNDRVNALAIAVILILINDRRFVDICAKLGVDEDVNLIPDSLNVAGDSYISANGNQTLN